MGSPWSNDEEGSSFASRLHCATNVDNN
ncbi:expressed unknown protein [Ectocarpus siliculosus]|uniref:Uncharacterized protein n=1 Tax=Ectocarpus siliculosus TaxID=2880 RepID=D8LDY6_ECTSI|nr:expressed unknown protein [Ectocarpus siliculosus]|eukprot:CBN75562.1 expressed unknown protein [Ectocarpus siliculosus]